MKAKASGGNEPPPFKAVGEFFGAYKKAIKARARPARRHWSYVANPDGTFTISGKDLAWLMSDAAKIEKSQYEEDLAMWYDQQGVSREPWLPGETLEQYKLRTEKK